jgi:hypothetical protein
MSSSLKDEIHQTAIDEPVMTNNEVSTTKRRSFSLFQWCLLALGLLLVLAIALGLGLGLGLGLKKNNNTPPLTTMGSTSTGNFNYSSYYGIPENLPVIQGLTNISELELTSLTKNRAFSLSDKPQERYYLFNITQVLGAPDGYQKPMIAINGLTTFHRSDDRTVSRAVNSGE